MQISVAPNFKVYSLRLPADLKERVSPTDEKTRKRAEDYQRLKDQGLSPEEIRAANKRAVGFTGGKQGGLSLTVRQLCHLYLGEQMPADQERLEVDENSPLRRDEAAVYALEAAAYDEGRELTARDKSELTAIEARMLDLAHELVAGRDPSFEQTLALVLFARCQVLAEHLHQQRLEK